MNPGLTIASIADRPDLIPLVAGWIWEAFWRGRRSLEDMRAAVAESVAGGPLPQCFVLLQDGQPVGTASLVAHDLSARPDLSPWLAAVVVIPPARGHGLAACLIAAVERAASAAGFHTLWLHTSTAMSVYARCGWVAVETIDRPGRPEVTLMRRDLSPS